MTLPVWLRLTDEGILLHIHVQPGAKHTEMAGNHGDALKVRIHAPPVEGKANQALLDYLCTHLGCRKNQVKLVSGERSREKRVLVRGMAPDEAVSAFTRE